MAERYGQSVQARLQQRVEYLDAYCGLSDKQRRRLEVATLGPSRTTGKQLQKRVGATVEIKDHTQARKELAKIRAEIDNALTKPFMSSFWKKTVESTLSEDQFKQLRENEKRRDEFARKAWVYKAVDQTDRDILLTGAQRDALLKQLEAYIKDNAIPVEQRGRRGAWRSIPEDVVARVVFPELDDLRRQKLIAIAPYRMREELTKKFLSAQDEEPKP